MVGLDAYIGINTPKLVVPANIQVRFNKSDIYLYTTEAYCGQFCFPSKCQL